MSPYNSVATDKYSGIAHPDRKTIKNTKISLSKYATTMPFEKYQLLENRV